MVNHEMTEEEYRQRRLQFIFDNIEEEKKNFIMEIQELAHKLNYTQFTSESGLLQLSQKSLDDLLVVKYELFIKSSNIYDLLVDFKNIGKFKTGL